MSLATNAASMPTEIAVPTPGTVDATPDATSPIAPTKSPFIALSIPKASPATAPNRGIFLARDLAIPFPAILAACLPTNLPTILPPNTPTGLIAFAPTLPALARARLPLRPIILLSRVLPLLNPNLPISLADPNRSFNLLPGRAAAPDIPRPNFKYCLFSALASCPSAPDSSSFLFASSAAFSAAIAASLATLLVSLV